jgi:cytochrome c556
MIKTDFHEMERQMNMIGKKIGAGIALLLLLAVPAVYAVMQEGHDHSAIHAAADNGANPLIEEMEKLDEVFRAVVSGVALGDGERVHAALESMHGTMEKTHEGVKAGKVTIPKNPAKVTEFVKMDKDFHVKLETLAHAAQKYDQKKMLLLTKQLLDGCVSCHQMFRK